MTGLEKPPPATKSPPRPQPQRVRDHRHRTQAHRRRRDDRTQQQSALPVQKSRAGDHPAHRERYHHEPQRRGDPQPPRQVVEFRFPLVLPATHPGLPSTRVPSRKSGTRPADPARSPGASGRCRASPSLGDPPAILPPEPRPGGNCSRRSASVMVNLSHAGARSAFQHHAQVPRIPRRIRQSERESLRPIPTTRQPRMPTEKRRIHPLTTHDHHPPSTVDQLDVNVRRTRHGVAEIQSSPTTNHPGVGIDGHVLEPQSGHQRRRRNAPRRSGPGKRQETKSNESQTKSFHIR